MTFDYKVIKSFRKTLAIEIKRDKTVLVRAPFFTSDRRIKSFLDKKAVWVEKHLRRLDEIKDREKFDRHQIKEMSDKSEILVKRLLEEYAPVMGVKFGAVRIKAQKSLWGSCSSKKNLNFNCLICLLPENVARYIIVHELSHLKEMNHSERFWNIVKTYCPDYKVCKKYLKDNGALLLIKL